MGLYDGKNFSLDEKAAEVLKDCGTEDDGGDALDGLIDQLVDDSSDIRAVVKLAVSGKDDAEVARKIRLLATHYAYRTAREAA